MAIVETVSLLKNIVINTPTPNQNENAKTTARSNFDAEAFGDMFSTLYNRI